MANALKEAVAEKIATMDQYGSKTSGRKGFNYRLVIPATLVTVATVTGCFFLVRRRRTTTEK